MQILLAVTEQFGESYLTHIMLPVFLVAVGESASFKFFPLAAETKLQGNVDFFLSASVATCK